MSERAAAIQRKTKETEIKLEVSLDGTGRVRADTGVGFLDHMLDHLGRHSLCDLTVRASGDAPSGAGPRTSTSDPGRSWRRPAGVSQAIKRP